MIRIFVLIVAILAVAGCGGTKRSTQQYRADSESLLESRRPQIETCYQKALEADPKAQGTLTVRFTIERKTGALVNPSIDASKSNAPEPVAACVMGALTGLILQPPDGNEGRGTFVYQLQPSA